MLYLHGSGFWVLCEGGGGGERLLVSRYFDRKVGRALTNCEWLIHFGGFDGVVLMLKKKSRGLGEPVGDSRSQSV